MYSQYHYSGSFGSLAGGFLPLFKGVFHLNNSGIILTLLVTLISHNLWLKLLRFRTRYPYKLVSELFDNSTRICCSIMSKLDIEKFEGKISFAIWRVQMLAVLTQNGLKKVHPDFSVS